MAYGPRSARTVPLPKDWPAIRTRILNRDGHACTWTDHGRACGSTGRLEVDHIGDPQDHRDENLRALCTTHHRRRSASQGGTAAAAKRIPRARPTQPHPGMII